MKIAYHTLGCRVNSYDTQMILTVLKERGHELVEDPNDADVFLVNTCAVTNESERKSRQLIRKYKSINPDAVVIATGCYPQTNENEIKNILEADIVTGTHNRMDIADMLDEFVKNRKRIVSVEQSTHKEEPITHFEDRTRAVVKIQDGCRMYCSYCIIPYARGEMKNMPIGEIISQVRGIVDNGYREVSLTGIHLASYNDRNGIRLIDVMERIDRETSIERLRLGSLEPKLLSEQFLKRLTKVKSFCPHFHISLQSGNDAILKRMNRHYDTEAYFRITQNVRRYFPDAILTTDVIAGFPTESEEDFLQTLDFVRKVGFYHVHAFPYSPKRGTPAAAMKGQINNSVKHERTQRLINVSREIQQEILQSNLNREFEVLCERVHDGVCEGLTRNYIKVYFHAPNAKSNRIYRVKSLKTAKDGLIGTLLD